MDDMSKSVSGIMRQLGSNARAAARQLSTAPTEQKNKALQEAASAIRADVAIILDANEKDVKKGEADGLTKAFLDRLTLTEDRIEAVAARA